MVTNYTPISGRVKKKIQKESKRIKIAHRHLMWYAFTPGKKKPAPNEGCRFSFFEIKHNRNASLTLPALQYRKNK
ncbi:MAG: hypothetical protein DRQ40_02175 [Gammaproteobacteria bacterium]|nr:MAG: hypothetical protein DRQ40_02175 [Gammaproteobacteria bacterium]